METTAGSRAPWAHFSTADVPGPNRVERWEEHTAETLAPIQVRTLQPDFRADMVRVAIGTLDVFRTTGSSHVLERSPRLVRAQPSGSVGVHVVLRGKSVYYTGEEILTLRPGQVLLQGDQPFLRCYADGLDDVSVNVPDSVYAELGHDVGPLPQVVDAGGPRGAYVRALGSLLRRATRSSTAAMPEEATVLELVSALAAGQRPSLSAAAHFAAAREVIERHLDDCGLGAGFVAARIGISGRHLSRVFASQGTTVPQMVRGLRLERAHRMLTAAGQRENLTVAEVAARCGFASASHFSHSFVARFGIRPADLVRQARGAAIVVG